MHANILGKIKPSQGETDNLDRLVAYRERRHPLVEETEDGVLGVEYLGDDKEPCRGVGAGGKHGTEYTGILPPTGGHPYP